MPTQYQRGLLQDVCSTNCGKCCLDDCCRLVLPYNAVHSIQQTEQIPNAPPRMGARSITTSSYPSTPVKAVKYMGVTIDDRLTWNEHVDTVVKKASSTRALLQRNITRCPHNIKEVCYRTLVRPTVKCAATSKL